MNVVHIYWSHFPRYVKVCNSKAWKVQNIDYYNILVIPTAQFGTTWGLCQHPEWGPGAWGNYGFNDHPFLRLFLHLATLLVNPQCRVQGHSHNMSNSLLSVLFSTDCNWKTNCHFWNTSGQFRLNIGPEHHFPILASFYILNNRICETESAQLKPCVCDEISQSKTLPGQKKMFPDSTTVTLKFCAYLLNIVAMNNIVTSAFVLT